MRNGKAKGDEYENHVCRIMSVWIVPGKWSKAPVWKLPFRRRFTDTTPLDGHWDGQGDLLHAPRVAFPFCVECKKIEGWEIDGALANAKWPVWSWWEQAKRQARKTWKTNGLYPLLVFSRNRKPDYVLLEEEVAQCLGLRPKSGPVLRVERPDGERLVLALLSDLTAVPKGTVTALARRRTMLGSRTRSSAAAR